MDFWLKSGRFGQWEPNHPGTMIRWYRGAPRRLTPNLAQALDRLQRGDFDALASDQHDDDLHHVIPAEDCAAAAGACYKLLLGWIRNGIQNNGSRSFIVEKLARTPN